MKTMEYLPGKEHLAIIEKLEQVARLRALSEPERLAYEPAVDAYVVERDAWQTAIEEGREEGIIEMARKLKALGVAIKDIISASGLSESVVASF